MQISHEHLYLMLRNYFDKDTGQFFKEYKPINRDEYEAAPENDGFVVLSLLCNDNSIVYTNPSGFYNSIETARTVLERRFSCGYQSPVQWTNYEKYTVGECWYTSPQPFNNTYKSYLVIAKDRFNVVPFDEFPIKWNPYIAKTIIERDLVNIDKYIFEIRDDGKYDLYEIREDAHYFVETRRWRIL